MKHRSPELSVNDLINILLSFTVSSMIIKNAILPGLSHNNLLLRYEVLTLLLSMLHQLKAISLYAKEFYKMIAIEKQITNVISRIPSLDIILQTWNCAFNMEANTNIEANTNMETQSGENIQNPELTDYFDIILNILHLYNDICPELLDNLTDLQLKMFLLNLKNFENENNGGVNIEKLNCVKIKAIQFLLVLDSTIFMPKEIIFKEAFFFLISLIRQKASLENYKTARTLLSATGLFETCDDQLDIWINGFSIITDPEENVELAEWFISVMKTVMKHTNRYVNSITQAEAALNEQHLTDFNIKKAGDIINELFDEANRSMKDISITELHLNNEQDNVTNDTFNRFNKKEKDVIKHTKIHAIIQRNKHSSKFHTEKMEDVINQLLDKTKPNNLFNGPLHDEIFSLPLINGQVAGLDVKKIDDVTDNSFDNLGEESFNSYRMQAYTSISPLLCCALRKASEEECSATVISYISYVLVHTLYHQVVPDLLIRLTTDLISLPVYKYLQHWSSDNQPISLKNKPKFLKLLHRTSNALLADSEMNITEVFKTSKGNYLTCCFKYDDKEVVINHFLSLHDIKALLRMTLFYLTQLAQRGILKQIQNENCKFMLVSLLNIIQSMNQENMKYFMIIEENAKYIFNHPILLHYFSPLCEEASKDSVENMITTTILKICETVMYLHEKTNVIDKKIYNMFFAFREKYFTQLQNIIEKDYLKAYGSNHDIVISLLKILQLKTEHIMNLLVALTKLKSAAFISNDKRNQSIFGTIFPILLDMYCDNESRLHHEYILDNEFVKKLSLHLIYLKSNQVNQMERWEQSLTNYLSIFPHKIANISSNTFTLLLTRDITKSTIQLITTLISRNAKLIPSLVKYFLKGNNAKQTDIVFPILACNLKDKWNETFLQRLYDYYSNDITTYLSEPGNPISWIEENVAAIVYLIQNTFDLALCEKTCNIISKIGDKMDMVSICFIHLLESLYKRYESLITVKEKALSNLIQILLYIMTLTLKKEAKNLEKIRVLCEKLDNAVACLRKAKPDFILDSLSKSHSWSQYTRFSLKLGLKDAKNDEIQSSILRVLNNLCDIAYSDNIEDEYAKTIFEMATSHSEFVNIMLESSVIKGEYARAMYFIIYTKIQ